MQLVGRDHPERRVAVLPPELVPDHGDFDRGGRLRRVLDGVNHASRRREQDQDDQDRNDRPRQLDLRAAIHLRRFAIGVRRRGAELHDGVDQETRDDDEDHPRDAQHEHRQIDDRLAGVDSGAKMLRRCMSFS